MAIVDYCRRDVATIDGSAAIHTAAARMAEESVGCLLVTEGGRLVGILTDRDVALRTIREDLDPHTTPVSKIAERDLVVLRSDRPVRIAMALMKRRGLRRLPVLDPAGTLVGIVTWDDLVGLIARELVEVAGTVAAQSPHLPIPRSRAVVEVLGEGGSE
jgi:CBS domain-containing protein